MCICAELLQGSGSQRVGGIVIVVVLPTLFLVWAAYFIVSYLHQAGRRRAAFILEEDPVNRMVGGTQRSSLQNFANAEFSWHACKCVLYLSEDVTCSG